MKSRVMRLIVASFIASLGFTSSVFAATTLRFAHGTSSPHPWAWGAEKFKEIVEKRTNGEIEISIFPGGQLGSVQKGMEGVRYGSIDITLIGTGVQGTLYVKEAGAMSLPYMFDSVEKASEVMTGPIGEDIAKKFEEKGFVHLAYWELGGFRHLTNNKRRITSVADVAGLKIRIQEGKHWEYLIKSWKAIPVFVPWTELFTAMQQGLADAQENPITSIYSSKIYEVQKYLALTQHVYDPTSLLMNPDKFKKLTTEQQKILIEAAKETHKYQKTYVAEETERNLNELKKAGIDIHKPDLADFMKTSRVVHEQIGKEDVIPMEYIKRVQKAAGWQ